jgi:hypothetical protein
MAGECEVCAHAEVKTLDRQLVSGAAAGTEIRPLRAGDHGPSQQTSRDSETAAFRPARRYTGLLDRRTDYDKVAAETRLSICGDDHKSAAALIRESRCIDEAVAKIRGFLDKGSHQGCIALAKHEFTIQLVTEALREFPEAPWP